jgi:type IV fimbrial biogenesis protein FimT
MMTISRNLRRTDGARGFTLVEVMIALAIGAVILLLAVPNFSTLLERNRIGSAADHLYASLAEARGEAVKRRTTVRVCPSADSASCRNDGDWSDGWLVFMDGDGNGAPNTDADIIKAVPSTSLAAGVDIECDTEVEDGVEFEATGATWDSTTNGAFWICHSDSDVPSKEISTSPSGRIEYTTRAQTDCASS